MKLRLLVAWFGCAGALSAAPRTDVARIAANFQEPRVGAIALAPDGRHLAYVANDLYRVYLMILDLDRGVPAGAVDVGQSSWWLKLRRGSWTPPQVTFLRWADARRLVYAEGVQHIYVLEGVGFARTELTPPEPEPAGARRRAWAVAGLPPDQPGVAILEARTPGMPAGTDEHAEWYRADLGTGRCTLLGAADLPAERRVYDRSGKLRVILDSATHRYELAAAGPVPWTRGAPLDSLLARAADRAFHVAPPNFYGSRAIPLGFGPDDNVLYYASNAQRDTYGVYALDVRTGTPTSWSCESADRDLIVPARVDEGRSPLVFDGPAGALVGIRQAQPDAPRTWWIDPTLAAQQAQLEASFPGRAVELCQWDAGHRRWLVLVSGPSDPGRYYLYYAGDHRWLQCARCMPWLGEDDVNPVAPLRAGVPDQPWEGRLTLPAAAGPGPWPVVVWCGDGPGGVLAPGFDSAAQTLAGLGFAVAQLDGRGSGGRGRRHLQAGARMERSVDDLLAGLGAAANLAALDLQRVTLVGEGWGGTLALRAAQLHPDRFCCAAVVNAPLDVAEWSREPPPPPSVLPALPRSAAEVLPSSVDGFLRAPEVAFVPDPASPRDFSAAVLRSFLGNDRKVFAAWSPASFPGQMTRPVMLVTDLSSPPLLAVQAERFRAAVRARGGRVEIFAWDGSSARPGLSPRAVLYAHLARFLLNEVNRAPSAGGRPTAPAPLSVKP